MKIKELKPVLRIAPEAKFGRFGGILSAKETGLGAISTRLGPCQKRPSTGPSPCKLWLSEGRGSGLVAGMLNRPSGVCEAV